jgi:hypothetical protein
MNSMTIFGLSSFSKIHIIIEIKRLKFNRKSFTSNEKTGFIKVLTNSAGSIKNKKNMTERSLSEPLFRITSIIRFSAQEGLYE